MAQPPLRELAGRILAARSIVLTTHAGPDGDGLGSLVALGRALESHEYTVLRLSPDPVPERYRFLDPSGQVHCVQEPWAKDAPGPWDLALALDTHQWAMLGEAGAWLQQRGIPTLFLDHHPQAEPLRPDVYGDSEAVATGELIYRLLHHQLGWSIDKDVAEPIYVAIAFDTSSFKYIRNNPASLLIAADLVTRGVDTNQIYRDLFASNSRGKARLLGWALSSVQFECDGRLAYVQIPNRVVEELSLERDEMRDSITHILEIKGVEIAVTLKELDPGLTNVSLRSKGACSINGIASQLGGGGHALAAGCDYPGTVEQAWQALKDPLIRLCQGT